MCVVGVPLTKFVMFARGAQGEGRGRVTPFVRFRAFTLRFGAFGNNSQTERHRGRKTEGKAARLAFWLWCKI